MTGVITTTFGIVASGTLYLIEINTKASVEMERIKSNEKAELHAFELKNRELDILQSLLDKEPNKAEQLKRDFIQRTVFSKEPIIVPRVSESSTSAAVSNQTNATQSKVL